MRRYLSIILLAITASVLGVVYYLLSENADPTSTGVLYSLGKNDQIEKINLTNQYGNFKFQKDGDDWMLKEPGEYHVSSLKASLIEKALTGLPAIRVLDEELPEYGLTPPRITVEFSTTTNKTHRFLIGNLTPSNAQTYIKDMDTGKVIVTDIGAVVHFDGSLAAYRGKEVFTIDKDNIKEITYKNNGDQQLTIHHYGPQDWRIIYPYNAPARFIEISEQVVKMRKWSVAGYPEPTDNYDTIGLENPAHELILTDADGKVQTFEFGNIDNGLIYVRSGSEEDIFNLFAIDVDFSIFSPEKMLFFAPLQTQIDQVESLTLSGFDRTSTFVLDQSSTPPEISISGKKIPYEEFVSLFVRIIGISATGYDNVSEPGDLYYEVKITMVDGSEKALALLKRDETTYFMKTAGITNFYISADDISEVKKLWDSLE